MELLSLSYQYWIIVLFYSSHRQLLDLSDDMATKVDVQFYLDARDALLKKGLIYSAERGQIAFTVPHFGRSLRDHA